MLDCRSLRKVMLRTCMGSDAATTGKEDPYPPHPPPNYCSAMAANGSAAAADRHAFDNGDIFSAKKADEFREALADVFPEDIPGLPRHRPGQYSPR